MENNTLKAQETPSVGLDHTPAPWQIANYSNYIGYAIHGGDYGCLAERWYEKSIPEDMDRQMKANARLISAAPELLESLTCIDGIMRDFHSGQIKDPLDALTLIEESLTETGRTAITKARASQVSQSKDDSLNSK